MRSNTRALTAGKIASFVWAGILLVALGAGLQPVPASAQVLLARGQLDQLVSRVALYPDPLLAQVLTASTYSNQIPEAAQWADQHSYLAGDNLAGAITQDNRRLEVAAARWAGLHADPTPRRLETCSKTRLTSGERTI